MDDELVERVREAAEVGALVNAIKHESEAQVGAIIGPLMNEHPEFRAHGDEIAGVVAPVVERVNAMDHEERRKHLAELAPAKLDAIEAEDDGEDHPLPDLPGVGDPADVEPGTVRMRVAPNPNGPWHLGHARMAAVVGTYKQRYDGSFVCRFDDTDPETKRPDLDAYDAILDAISYLGFEPDRVLKASDRMEIYYEYARELIEAGGAYTCSCPPEKFSELKNAADACPHRETGTEDSLAEFEAMVDGEFSAGEKVLRVKTDIQHKNPALRDWVAFRMVDTPHPRPQASEYRCWPMLDFQSGIDDHLLEVSHIIRGIDLQDSAKRQQFVYDYFGWPYPEVIHWGHIQVDAYDVPLSTSSIRELIEAGELEGWDDPRAPTVASLRRRGIRGPAIVDAMVELGTSTSNVDLAMSTIYAANRDRIDAETDRAFFVSEGVEKPVEGGPEAGAPPVHPNHEDRGTRRIPVTGAVLVEHADVPADDEKVWLKGYGCVRHEDGAFEYTGDGIQAVKSGKVDVIHWVPADASVDTRLRTMNEDVSGRAEPGVLEYDEGSLLQFERVGFVRLDEHGRRETVAYFAHD